MPPRRVHNIIWTASTLSAQMIPGCLRRLFFLESYPSSITSPHHPTHIEYYPTQRCQKHDPVKDQKGGAPSFCRRTGLCWILFAAFPSTSLRLRALGLRSRGDGL